MHSARFAALLLAITAVVVPSRASSAIHKRVLDAADVAIAASASADTVTVGDDVSLTLAATNLSPAEAEGVSVSSSVKGAKATIVSATASQGSCTVSSTSKGAHCRLGNLSAGGHATVTLVAKTAAAGDLETAASVSARNPDPDTSTQRATLITRVVEHDSPTDVQVSGHAFEAAFQTRPTFWVTWSGTDTGSGIAAFDVRVRSAPYKASFGDYRLIEEAATTKRTRFAGAAGATYCFSARATDRDGNVSAWSVERCTAVFLGARGLSTLGAWRLHRSAHAWSARLSSRARGARIVLPVVVATKILLDAVAAPKAGTLLVSWNGRVIRRVVLSAAHRRRVLLPVASFHRVARGRLTFEVVSENRTATVYGVGITQAGDGG